uniref:30S ribosomal protein S5 n=1 Tax=Nephromyces sp. ex Molgula occidentalis TaxID=2544991 RepID=A0A5C1HA89_9APIC|nr:30S ribosomal protein S5 [Nephromyces sp. ex Molgula occidentalis]
MILNYNIKYFFSKKIDLNQQLISYFFTKNLNFNLYFNFILYKNLLSLLLNIYIFQPNLNYIYFLYSFLNFLKYNILKNIIFLIKYKFLISKSKNTLNFNKNLIKYKILNIQKISKTTKKGRNKKFKLLTVSGNSTGWVGIGQGKDSNFLTAVNNSYKNSLKNIYFIEKYYFNNLFYKFKSSKLLIKSNFNYGKGIKSSMYLKNIFELAGNNNIVTKRIGSRNKLNIINILLKNFKKNYNNNDNLLNIKIKDYNYFKNCFKIS